MSHLLGQLLPSTHEEDQPETAVTQVETKLV